MTEDTIELVPDMNIKPIGKVIEGFQSLHETQLFERKVSKILILDEFYEAMFLMDRNSYFWILSWMHLTNRQVLRASPKWIEKMTVEFGVFGLRSPSRPNPIGLSLVKLLSKTDNVLTVLGLDLLEGTPILDIKPYVDTDTVFSPNAPYMRPKDENLRFQRMLINAIHFHQEDCLDLQIALRMAVIAEKSFFTLSSDHLLIRVIGSRCLLDTIQGITRSRFANPNRLSFEENNQIAKTVWQYHNHLLTISVKDQLSLNHEKIQDLNDNILFDIEWRTI